MNNAEEELHFVPNAVLTVDQIQTFLKDGVLVVDNILSADQIQSALQGLNESLFTRAGVDTANLDETGHGLVNLSSTNGSGGVLDLFYEDWKCEIATNPKLFSATTQLWEAAYCNQGESLNDLLTPSEEKDKVFKWHPYGAFDVRTGFCYVDRIGYRLPTELATKLGSDLQEQQQQLRDPTSKKTKKMKKQFAVQRSLTPHLDCCPDTFFSEGKSKWRPIQCFVSLTDTLNANEGGFEAAKGFHRNFHRWTKERLPTRQVVKHKQQKQQQPGRGKCIVMEEEIFFPAPCIGDYTHIRPVEDRAIMEQVQHVPVRAGSAVFFDNRIPHANAYRHNGTEPRAVVYCSFLPNVAINQPFVAQQLFKWKRGVPPNDQWINMEAPFGDVEDRDVELAHPSWLTPLAKKLMGIDPW